MGIVSAGLRAEEDAELAGSGRCGGISDFMTPEVPSFLDSLRDHPDLLLPSLPHHLPPPPLSAQSVVSKIQPIPCLQSSEHAEMGSTKVPERLCFTFCLQHLSPSVQMWREIIFHIFFCLIVCKSLVFAFPQVRIIPSPSFKNRCLIVDEVIPWEFSL